MTRIEDDTVFVHTSDIQLLDDDTVDLVLEWQPDILLAGGPPLYLEQLSSKLRNRERFSSIIFSQGEKILNPMFNLSYCKKNEKSKRISLKILPANKDLL